jgi:tetratricopeptide (TPR) repeat protein
VPTVTIEVNVTRETGNTRSVAVVLSAWVVITAAAFGVSAGDDQTEVTDSGLNCLGELSAGYEALEDERYDTAARHYRAAFEKAQNSTYRFQALFGLGSTYSAMERHDEAAAAFQRAHELRPGHAETLYLMGLALASAGRIDEAVAALEKSVAEAPDLAAAHHGLSLMYAQLGWHEQAAAACRRVLEMDPDYVEAWIGLGVALYHSESYADAVPAFVRATELDPGNARAYYGLGLAYLLDGRREAAVEQYVRLNELDKKLAADLYEKIIEWSQEG